MSQIRTKLFAAQAELVERKEVLKAMSNAPSPTVLNQPIRNDGPFHRQG